MEFFVVKSMPTLIKLAKQKVDEQQLRLVHLLTEQDNLKQQVYVFEQNLKDEANRARHDPHLVLQYGRYAQDIEARMEHLKAKITDLQTKIDIEQNRLTMLFKEQKVLEVYKDKQETLQKQQKKKKDQSKLDEMAARLHHFKSENGL